MPPACTATLTPKLPVASSSPFHPPAPPGKHTHTHTPVTRPGFATHFELCFRTKMPNLDCFQLGSAPGNPEPPSRPLTNDWASEAEPMSPKGAPSPLPRPQGGGAVGQWGREGVVGTKDYVNYNSQQTSCRTTARVSGPRIKGKGFLFCFVCTISFSRIRLGRERWWLPPSIPALGRRVPGLQRVSVPGVGWGVGRGGQGLEEREAEAGRSL